QHSSQTDNQHRKSHFNTAFARLVHNQQDSQVLMEILPFSQSRTLWDKLALKRPNERKSCSISLIAPLRCTSLIQELGLTYFFLNGNSCTGAVGCAPEGIPAVFSMMCVGCGISPELGSLGVRTPEGLPIPGRGLTAPLGKPLGGTGI